MPIRGIRSLHLFAGRGIGCLLLGVALFAVACSGPRESVRETEEPEATTVADVETFDAVSYRPESPEEPPPPTVEHEVPEVLMAGGDTSESDSAVAPVRRAGFRVQVFSSEEKNRAEELMSDAVTWWETVHAEVDSIRSAFPADLPVYIEYGAPYYRVRLGDFLRRVRAEEAAAVIRKRFPDAWVVPDQVLVYR